MRAAAFSNFVSLIDEVMRLANKPFVFKMSFVPSQKSLQRQIYKRSVKRYKDEGLLYRDVRNRDDKVYETKLCYGLLITDRCPYHSKCNLKERSKFNM